MSKSNYLLKYDLCSIICVHIGNNVSTTEISALQITKKTNCNILHRYVGITLHYALYKNVGITLQYEHMAKPEKCE